MTPRLPARCWRGRLPTPDLELFVVASLLAVGAFASPRQIWRDERWGGSGGALPRRHPSTLVARAQRWSGGGSGGGRENERCDGGAMGEGEGVVVVSREAKAYPCYHVADSKAADSSGNGRLLQ